MSDTLKAQLDAQERLIARLRADLSETRITIARLRTALEAYAHLQY